MTLLQHIAHALDQIGVVTPPKAVVSKPTPYTAWKPTLEQTEPPF